ncbi:MAG TPA: cytochrome c oxidase subunit II [Candidatus Udaeobacter sp.]|jgi:cytochrome c oxidase subunit 2|nr:cytochrome c oxidase subunit II [Candidatus Udaeobacter sp.]
MSAAEFQSALNPAASESAHIAHLWWIFFWVTLVIFALVAVFLFIAILRNLRRVPDDPERAIIPEPAQATESRATKVVSALVVITVLILFALLIGDFFTGNAIYATPDPKALAIKVTGHQWWWEVQYQDPQPSEIVTTANEIHVPVGKAVKLELQSTDVIHSFWVPNINGKKDLVPGHPTTTWFTARRAGEFRGQCAEYCGEQHAHMRMVFVAEPPDAFSNWLSAQKKPAPEPSSDSQRRGREVFLASQCVMCHTIQGTKARATLGPDLTHIGARKMIAAGELPNTRGYLAGWILNAPALKPGVRMPPNQMSADDLNALLDYLESLK